MKINVNKFSRQNCADARIRGYRRIGDYMKDNCIFCNIIEGKIPSDIIYEDGDFKVIMDISPAAKGHAILLSKKHFENLFELEEDIVAKALVVAKKVALAMKEELGFDGINLLQNNGEASGQTVFHFHIHLIPRFKEDQVEITWIKGRYADGDAAKVAKAIAGRIK